MLTTFRKSSPTSSSIKDSRISVEVEIATSQKEFAVITITENKKIYDGVQCGRWVLQKLNHRGARRYAQEKGGNQGESKANKQPFFKNTVTSTMFKIAMRGLHRQAKNGPLHKQKQWRSV